MKENSKTAYIKRLKTQIENILDRNNCQNHDR